jgi:diguanylate cyclase (GGDEF)-like protein
VSEHRSVDHDIAAVERRESRLWWVAIALLVMFVAATLSAAYVITVAGPNAASHGSRLVPALIGFSVLVLVFCVYVVVSRSAFTRVRRIFEAQAVRDSLTGLLNRQSFPDQVRREMALTDRRGATMGLLLCDLDDFKRINDTFGHLAGDRVLKRVGLAVLSATRGSDLVFRWGGDEIVTLLSPTARDGAMAAAQRVRSEVRAVSQSLGYDLDISIGLAFYPEHGATIEELLRLADRALYIAKGSSNKIHIGEEQLPVDDTAVKLVFQPVVDSTSRAVIGYEALGRDPAGGSGAEALFRRYAATGQLTDLKRMLFERQVREADRLGLGRVFVNVDLELLSSVETMPCPQGLEVVLEIPETETTKATADSLAVIGEWRRLGFKIAIDDFGSGFVSLPFLARLLPDFIKMDKGAMHESGDSERFSSFMKDLVTAMRHYSREGIIAEGIETEQEFQLARLVGVDQVQGNLTGRPEVLTGRPNGAMPIQDEGI